MTQMTHKPSEPKELTPVAHGAAVLAIVVEKLGKLTPEYRARVLAAVHQYFSDEKDTP